MSRTIFCAAAALGLAACATIPPDRGRSEIEQALAQRGQIWPADTGLDREAATARLLAQPLSLSDAISIALLNNPAVDAAYARLGLAGAEVLRAGRLSNPRLDVSLGLPLVDHAVDRFSFGLAEDFLQLLFLPARSRFARADFERAKAEAGAAVLDLAAEVADAYFGCVTAQQRVRLQSQAAAAAILSADYAQALAQAGNLDALALVLQQADAAQVEADALDAQARLDGARVALNRVMGLHTKVADWHINASLQLPVEHEDDANALLALADRERLDLQAAQARVDALRDAAGIAGIGAALAGSEIGADYQHDSDGLRSAGPRLNLSIPLFDQGQAARLQAQAGIELAQAQRNALRLDVASQVQAAVDRVASAHQRIELIRRRLLPLRAAAVHATQQRVNFALLGVFAALEAKQQEYAARTRYLEALGDYWHSRVALAHAIGTRLPSDTQLTTADQQDTADDDGSSDLSSHSDPAHPTGVQP